MMRRAAVRRGPGVVGTMARTAVIAGTATATSRAINSRMDRKQAEKLAAQQQAAEQAQQAAAQQGQEKKPEEAA